MELYSLIVDIHNMTFTNPESSIDLNKGLSARAMGAEPTILLADARTTGRQPARTINDGSGALPNAAVTNDSPAATLANNTNPFNQATPSQEYMQLLEAGLVTQAITGNQGFVPGMPFQPGVPQRGINNPLNPSNYYRNPAGPANSIIFRTNNDGTLTDPRNGQSIPVNGDSNYVKVNNPNNPASFTEDNSGNPIDPRTGQIVSNGDPRYNNMTNPDYYLKDPVTGLMINPYTGVLGNPSNQSNPLVPNQNQNGRVNPYTPNRNIGNAGAGMGMGGGMGGMGGLLRIGMMVGLMAMMFGRGGGGGMGAMMMPLMAMGMMGGMGGGGMMGGMLPMMLMGSLLGGGGLFGGGGSSTSNPVRSTVRAAARKR